MALPNSVLKRNWSVITAPIRTGPSVSIDQYSTSRCHKGRGFAVRQMPLSVASMVSIALSAVAKKKIVPIRESRSAEATNWFTTPTTVALIEGRNRLFSMKRSRFACTD